jgi:ubiquinone/menaquinone biosynthesis C-methylase UbiE
LTDLITNRLNLADATERIDPKQTAPGILSIHLKRYEFALETCLGKTVLDAACGVGYGSTYLSKVANHVTGIDIDATAIAYAQQHYQSPNVTFQVEDATETKFPDAHFEVICSFETIEHLSDIPAYLREVVRLLTDDGIYFVSTPQVPQTTLHPSNPYHTIEFSRNDFQVLLNSYFSHVEIYGQRRKQSELHYRITQFFNLIGLRGRLPKLEKLRTSVNQALATTTFEQMALADILITQSQIQRASEIIAICKKPKK